jgi:uncharacterized protein YcbX
MRIERIYRYPVKGLSAEALEEVAVETGECLPWDRAFALAQGDAPFDPEDPHWLQKSHFMCLMKNARIARLHSAFDPRSGMLVIRGPEGDIAENALTPEGRAAIGAWLTRAMGEEVRGTPRFHHVPGHSFCDQRSKVVSLISLASLAAFEAAVGAPRELMRFRANVYFTGARPWTELDWVGQEILVGGARMKVVKRIVRCAATEVNLETGERDADPVKELRALYGHADLGVHAQVIEGGKLAVGEAIQVLG